MMMILLRNLQCRSIRNGQSQKDHGVLHFHGKPAKAS